MTHENAVSILRENAGRQFDARVVAVFLSLPPEILARHSRPLELRFDEEEPALAVGD
jgi:HD-GYP domain-containing protein (c-di-GMP phosphodiesterase class II)